MSDKRARERTSGEEEEPAAAAVGARTSGEDQAEAPAASAAAVAAEDDEGPLCRYCFEGESEGELLSPCDCKGGQKWVHLHCLRRWQRMVLVSQPTHPAFYTSDARHHTCGVCAAPFTCAPPTRHELMSSFTGPELGALVDAGCMIGAHAGFSAELSRSLGSMSEYVAEESSYRHWIGGAYLITETAAATPDLTISLQSREDIALLCSNLGEGDAFQGPRGVTLRLAARGALSPPPEGEEAAGETVRGRLARLEQRALVEPGAVLPVDVTLLKEPAPDCGEDHITAVNLTRIVPQPSLRMARPVEAAKEALAQRFPQVDPSRVRVQHYRGGPCGSGEVACCIVTGGGSAGSSGWSVAEGIVAALELAFSRATPRSTEQGEFVCGQPVRLAGLVARPDLNDALGIALRFDESSRRWLVRLADGDGKALKPANLRPLSEAQRGPDVLIFWGDAQWSRTQLLGELARGHWGLCRASAADLVAEPATRRDGLEGRLVYAPKTEMSEAFLTAAAAQMQAERERRAREDAEEWVQEAAEAAEQGGGSADALPMEGA